MLSDSHSHSIEKYNMFLCSENSNYWEYILKAKSKKNKIYKFIGIHPFETSTQENFDIKLHKLEQLLIKNNKLSIGEFGLDFFYNKKYTLQEKIFKDQLNLAKKYNRAVNIHIVKAWHRALPIIKEYTNFPIIIHSYKASTNITNQLNELSNVFFSINANNIFNKNILKIINKKRLILETDYEAKSNKKYDLQNTYKIITKFINIDKKRINKNFNKITKYIEDEIIDIYENFSTIIYTAKKYTAHKKGLLHKTVHIWIKNEFNELLIQKRSLNKKIFPNIFDISVAGHIHSKESTINAALREIQEEIGLSINKKELSYKCEIIEKTNTNNLIDHEIHEIFFLKIPQNASFSIDKKELSELKWISKKEFKKLISNKNFVSHDPKYIKYILNNFF